MSDLRTAAQQALEALEYDNPAGRTATITALKAALAEPVQEPVDTDCHTQGICQRSGYGIGKQAEPGEPVAHRVVVGALFDFMGWLTSRRERLVLSSTDDAAPAADAIKDFAEMRGLSLDDAKVQDWNAAPPQQAEPVLQTCNCRWDGEVQVQQCTLHEAHVDAIHEWAERAKVAERKLAQQAEPQTTHSSECWRWHHKCAVAKIERECKHD